MLADLKTESSKRTLAMPARLARALRALKVAQATDKLMLGVYYTDHGIVFCGDSGQPRQRQNVQTGFKRVCKAAGIEGDWWPHLMRHSFVSALSDRGVSIEDISDAVGHTSSTVTGEVYRHQISDVVTRSSATMDDIFGA